MEPAIAVYHCGSLRGDLWSALIHGFRPVDISPFSRYRPDPDMSGTPTDSRQLRFPDICESSQPPWYLAYTRPRQESVAQFNLERQRFEVYLPLYKDLAPGPSASAIQHTPMFARYLFFRASHPGQSLSPVNSTRGVATIVQFGHELATVPSSVIDAIRAIEEQRNSTPAHQLKEWKTGSLVRLKSSALQGLEGIVTSVSKRRVEVLMELMGRMQTLIVSHEQLVEV